MVSPGQGVTLRAGSFATSNCPLVVSNQVAHHRPEGRAVTICTEKCIGYFFTGLLKAEESLSGKSFPVLHTHRATALIGGLLRNCESPGICGCSRGQVQYSIQTLPCSVPKPGLRETGLLISPQLISPDGPVNLICMRILGSPWKTVARTLGWISLPGRHRT